MPPALRIKDLTFRYFERGKRNILDHVSLEIEEGRTTLLMGNSGCGKSTLAAVVSGLYPENGGFLESGTMELFGVPVSSLNPSRRAAYLTEMFQNPDLQFCMDTLRGEMRFCMENIRVAPSEMDRRMERAAGRMGVAPLLDRKLHTLSGGEKQRAALTCLAVMESRCVLLDEPFANIDRDAAAGLIRKFQELKDAGHTLVAIDHRPDLWLDLADEIIILGEGGKVLQRGITRETLPLYSRLFEEQGLFYPDPKREARRTLNRPIAGEPAVSFEGVYLSNEGTSLLWDAEAAFPSGCMTAVLGPSGSGKTTAFLAALGQHPYEGVIRIHGTDIHKMKKKELYKEVGIVFQNPANQFISQNVEEEVRASIRVWDKGLSDAECSARAEEELAGFGLLPYRRYSPYMLSQGQQRKLAVLSVLAGGQSVLFLDEPTYGQDCRSTASIMTTLRKKVDAENLSVIFITHDRELADAWADRIYCLEDQRLVERRGVS